MPMKFLITVCLAVSGIILQAQDSARKHTFSLGGFIECYYKTALQAAAGADPEFFLYNFRKQQQPRLNLALVKSSYSGKNIKANIALMAGDYSQYNLAAEPGLLQHVFEASINISISKKWSADAGILPSHIGLESAIGKDNWNTSRSLLAENSPYYETGIKLNFQATGRLSIAALLLNGWQHIKDNNSYPAWGTQVQYRAGKSWLLNSSTFIGRENAGNAAAMRLFHNLYATGAVAKKWNAAFLFDIGFQKRTGNNGYAQWLGTGALVQYTISSRFKAAGRAEYFKDSEQVLVATGTAHGFNTASFSVSADYSPAEHILLRAEIRSYTGKDAIFSHNLKPATGMGNVLFAASYWF